MVVAFVAVRPCCERLAVTASNLLSLEVLIHAGLAVLLLATPGLLIRTLGWPPETTRFWPRLLGALLAAIALGLLTTQMGWSRDGTSAGIGLAGIIVINLTMAFTLFTMLFLGPHAPTRRGRIVVGALAGVLLLLALVEIAYV